jgi:hypothetical protein
MKALDYVVGAAEALFLGALAGLAIVSPIAVVGAVLS